MASGHTHNAYNTGLFLATMFAGLAGGIPADKVAALSLGVSVGFLVNPDLDVESGSIAFYNARRTAGGLFGLAWRIIWWPYAKVVPHRSPLSHFPVLGTLIRVSYLGLLMWPAWPFIPWGAVLPWLGPALLGLVLSDTVHWILDMKTFKVFVMWGRAVFWFALLPMLLGLLAWWLLAGR
jgi:uncharacterized metal-binding protein